ncbi:hypothetical protein [Azospirillum sp. B510]|nr:hypothetical protein [Azospirillum sp. B510]
MPKRPYQGTDTSAAMQGHIDRNLEPVDQLKCDGTHDFHIIRCPR